MRQLVALALMGVVIVLAVVEEKRDIIMGLPGGIYEGELDDPGTQEAVKQALGEFKNRAVKSGRLGSGSVVLVGDVVDVKTQVVAGQKYIITVNLGLTSDSGCKAKSEDGFVSAKVCKDTKSLGVHKVEVINQPWMPTKYLFTEFEDVEGPELASVWKAGAN